MGLVINGQIHEAPGLRALSWLDQPLLRLTMHEDCRERYTRWVRNITLHTTKGIPYSRDPRPQRILPGLGPDAGGDIRVARSWASNSKRAGAHLVVDFDGSVACLEDLATVAAYHAGEVNEVSIGIEIYQGDEAELYDGQLDAVVRLLDCITRLMGIQRQIQWPRHRRPAPRIAAGAQTVVGIYGHCDVTTNRGPGDPGEAIFEKLRAAGYEPLDFTSGQDLAEWKDRQAQLNQDFDVKLALDGIPGPLTVAALRRAGRAHGLWVTRPDD